MFWNSLMFNPLTAKFFFVLIYFILIDLHHITTKIMHIFKLHRHIVQNLKFKSDPQMGITIDTI